jgi:AraC-like DNA-binding protein
MSDSALNESEQLVLLALLRLGDDAYGVPILFEEAGDVAKARAWADQAPVHNRERALQLSELIAAYLCELIENPAEMQLDRQEQQLMALWRDVNRSLHQDWDIKAFARFLNISTASVQRWMHKYYGKSCHQLLIEQRMQRATQLLQHTDYTLENIAGQLGYCDAYTFSNAFKKHNGMAPAYFRSKSV